MMTKPVRIQLRRTKGFRLQEVSRAINGLPAVNVARPSKWGNPIKVGREIEVWFVFKTVRIRPQSREDAVRWFSSVVRDNRRCSFMAEYPSIEEIRRELRGKNLACWCPTDHPCHADVLLEIANDWPDTAIAIAQRGGRK